MRSLLGKDNTIKTFKQCVQFSLEKTFGKGSKWYEAILLGYTEQVDKQHRINKSNKETLEACNVEYKSGSTDRTFMSFQNSLFKISLGVYGRNTETQPKNSERKLELANAKLEAVAALRRLKPPFNDQEWFQLKLKEVIKKTAHNSSEYYQYFANLKLIDCFIYKYDGDIDNLIVNKMDAPSETQLKKVVYRVFKKLQIAVPVYDFLRTPQDNQVRPNHKITCTVMSAKRRKRNEKLHIDKTKI